MSQLLLCVHHFSSNNPLILQFFTLQLACWWNTLSKFTSGVIALTVTALSQEEVLTDHIFIDGFASCFSWRISQPETSTEIALFKYQSRSLREKNTL